MQRSAGLFVTSLLIALAFTGCGGGNSSLFGPSPSPTPVTPNVSLEINLPTANSGPTALTRGPDSNIWVTETKASKIAKVAGATSVSEFPTIVPNAGPTSIIAGPDSGLWVTYSIADRIARVTPTSGGITEYPLTAGTHPQEIISAGTPTGSNLYFTEFGANKIGVMTTAGILLSEFPLPNAGSGPYSLIQGTDNAIWFTELNRSAIGRMLVGGQFTNEFPTITANAQPQTIILGPDGALWFVEEGPQKLGRITLAGQMSEVSIAPAASIHGLVVGVDNKFYFGDPVANKIAQYDIVAGTIKEFSIPTPGAMPFGMTLGVDGKVYFSENATSKIGQLTYF
ncbi:MAG: Virginiamycin B lyase [Candidatus Eremiobacteraeota bacterium]|nr:Virginiamycin B lyase [Candidatus Eremiobacteraeota bacterium]